MCSASLGNIFMWLKRNVNIEHVSCYELNQCNFFILCLLSQFGSSTQVNCNVLALILPYKETMDRQVYCFSCFGIQIRQKI